MSDIATIKNQMATELQNLVNAGTIGGYTRLQLSQSYFDIQNLGGYPHALLAPPTMEDTEQLDNRNAIRTASFTIDVIFQAQNLVNDNDIETTLEAIMNHFDDVSDDLEGDANGGIETASTSPQYTDGADRSLVAAAVQLKVRYTRQMQF
jgi:hypothetical protein